MYAWESFCFGFKLDSFFKNHNLTNINIFFICHTFTVHIFKCSYDNLTHDRLSSSTSFSVFSWVVSHGINH